LLAVFVLAGWVFLEPQASPPARAAAAIAPAPPTFRTRRREYLLLTVLDQYPPLSDMVESPLHLPAGTQTAVALLLTDRQRSSGVLAAEQAIRQILRL
jgi:hypothetical protein